MEIMGGDMKKMFMLCVLLLATAVAGAAEIAPTVYQCTLNNQQIEMRFYSEGSVFSPWSESGTVDVYINTTKYQTYKYDATDHEVQVTDLGTFYKIENKLILPAVTLNGL